MAQNVGCHWPISLENLKSKKKAAKNWQIFFFYFHENFLETVQGNYCPKVFYFREILSAQNDNKNYDPLLLLTNW